MKPRICKCCKQPSLYVRRDMGHYCRPCDGKPSDPVFLLPDFAKLSKPKGREWADRAPT